MPRGAPWLLFGACVLAGAGLWFYRAHPLIAGPVSPQGVVRNAWTEGRAVALDGSQIIRLTLGPDRKRVEIRAAVLTSHDGQMRIEYLSDRLDGVKVWETADRTYRFNPRLQHLTVAGRRASAAEQAAQELQLLESNYEASFAGKGVVAGRPVLIVELRPRGGGERWKRLWIDSETWVILRSQDRRGPEEVLRDTRFTAVRYLNTPPDETEFRPSEEMIRRYAVALREGSTDRFEPERLARLVGFPVRVPDWVPRGYAFEGAFPIPCPCGQHHQAVRLEYSDGLNTLTLFQAGYPGCTAASKDPEGEVPMSARLVSNGVHYLAVGELPEETLIRVIRSAAAR